MNGNFEQKLRPSISLVVCTLNGKARLLDSLGAIGLQVVPAGLNWEVIVVDNGSDDGSAELAKHVFEFAGLRNHEVVVEPRRGLFNARRAGVQRARGDVISFIDDDNIVGKDWVRKLSEVFTDPCLSACGPKINPILTRGEAPSWFPLFQRAYAAGEQDVGINCSPPTLWGAGLSIRRELMLRIYGEDIDLLLTGRTGGTQSAGDDTELCYLLNAAKAKILYSRDLVIGHSIPPTRLSLDYLGRLYDGFGASDAVLEMYRVLLRLHPLSDASLIVMAFPICICQVINSFYNYAKFTLLGRCVLFYNRGGSRSLKISMQRRASAAKLHALLRLNYVTTIRAVNKNARSMRRI